MAKVIHTEFVDSIQESFKESESGSEYDEEDDDADERMHDGSKGTDSEGDAAAKAT